MNVKRTFALNAQQSHIILVKHASSLKNLKRQESADFV